MLQESLRQLEAWSLIDTWMVLITALAGMACAIPGSFLLLRRQSMMGDALSHTSLLGIVLAFLFSGWLLAGGSAEEVGSTVHWLMVLGAILTGMLAALLTEAIQKLGRVEATAALGVVFTTMFAMGLLLMRLVDTAHIDAECVLYGSVATMIMDTITLGEVELPRAVVFNGVMLAVNLGLVVLFFKELRISTFDAELATALGINAAWINYVLMAVTAATIVAVFESVGSIIVIAMLIVPPATAFLLTSRLERMIPVSLILAGLSAILGHVFARLLPIVLFPALGFEHGGEASTAGMMAAASGLLFFLALFLAPRQGILSRYLHQTALSLKVAADDLLGLLYRMEEWQLEQETALAPSLLAQQLGYRKLIPHLALRWLIRQGQIEKTAGEYHLTDTGRGRARELVRAHRLWESYMAHHFNLPDERLHQSAHRIEHYLDPPLRQDLATELKSPTEDPHGRTIPEEHDSDKTSGECG